MKKKKTARHWPSKTTSPLCVRVPNKLRDQARAVGRDVWPDAGGDARYGPLLPGEPLKSFMLDAISSEINRRRAITLCAIQAVK